VFACALNTRGGTGHEGVEDPYVDLGSVTNSFTSAPGAGLVPTTAQTTSAYSIHDHIVRLGINYRWN